MSEVDQNYYLVLTHPRDGAGDRSLAREAHQAFRKELKDQGIILVSGPLVDEETGQSIGGGAAVMRARSLAQAEAILNEDPYVKGGYRTVEIKAWRISGLG